VQLAHGYLTDGKVEQEALDEWKKKKRAQLRTTAASAQGQLSMAMGRRFYGNDPRFLDLTPGQISQLTPEQGERWLKRIVNSGAVEVSFVGDITLERALELACRYVGCLPKRSLNAWQALDTLRRIDRGPGPYTEIVRFDSGGDQAYVAAGFVGAPLKEVTDGRRLTLAARIISQRLLDRLREEKKLVRNMRGTNRPSIAVPGTGVFGAGGAVRPDDAEATLDLIIDMIREFGENGPTEEELSAVKTQLVGQLEGSMGTVSFWSGQLREFKYRNRSLDELKELPGVYEDITAEQLKAAVKKYTTDERMFRFAAISNPIAPPDSDDAEEEMSVEPEQP
jgi:zinc protease